MSLAKQESIYLEKKIGRKPTSTEFQIVAAEWSEHCSYKSSKKHLKMLPMSGPHVISEKGYDSGVLDVGEDYVVTVHIESHNHPSAVEPFGGAATGVGGVIRDILSAGTRPIAILDGLRFGDIEKDTHARWLFKNAVSGIADYGNCLGIPTIGGEVEFDNCYSNYALVDVAAIGFGKKDKLIKNKATKGDLVVLIGGPTGRDGIGGSQFASDSLESENRSAVQIPDPFIEKLIIETILEARDQKCIKAMKDLGGGGLSCAVSETADSLGVGIELDVNEIHTREPDMNPDEIMVSESQERMLIITDKKKLNTLKLICKKFHVQCSVIGIVKTNSLMQVKKGKKILASLPSKIVANAPLLDRPSTIPTYLNKLEKNPFLKTPTNFSNTLLKMISSPNIANKNWVYGQYDHEVGIRTVIKPGNDASVLRLDNGKFLAAKIDGNPKHCYIDPRQGAIGCFEEACRNVVCTGATPIGMVDHLQFGNPENPEIYWTFLESLKGITDFAKYIKIPCVGGKVSFYNETPKGPIKPTPLIGVLGLVEKHHPLYPLKILKDDILVIVGQTKNEMGGSEYFEYIHGLIGGKCPKVDFKTSKKNMDIILEVIRQNIVKCVHDCSKGGLSIAISELCMNNNIGCMISLEKIPSEKLQTEQLLFSESHSRYLLVAEKKNLKKILNILSKKAVKYNVIGAFGGSNIIIERNSKNIVNLRVDKARLKWMNSLEELVLHG
jgi:phosphoribosylformylglycinamidine synthase subunit PurL